MDDKKKYNMINKDEEDEGNYPSSQNISKDESKVNFMKPTNPVGISTIFNKLNQKKTSKVDDVKKDSKNSSASNSYSNKLVLKDDNSKDKLVKSASGKNFKEDEESQIIKPKHSINQSDKSEKSDKSSKSSKSDKSDNGFDHENGSDKEKNSYRSQDNDKRRLTKREKIVIIIINVSFIF